MFKVASNSTYKTENPTTINLKNAKNYEKNDKICI